MTLRRQPHSARTTSRITLEVEVGHAGRAQTLGDHLAAEVVDLLAGWGNEAGCVAVDVEALDVEPS